jgi:uncharacterized membrane protein YuzA (DUF378 family)
MRAGLGRWLLSLLIGYIVASGLNWAIAGKFLNDIIKPGFGPLMRTSANTRVGVIVGGFALLMVVLSLVCALLRAPDRWLPRGLAAGGIVSLGLFAAYTFLSGWLDLPTREMCLTATADSFTVIIGALVMTRIQDWH